MSVGLMPPRSRPENFETCSMTVATGKYGMLVVRDTGTANHDDVKITTDAGQQMLGVIASQGDPNDSGLFDSGDQVSVAKGGTCEVLFEATTVITKGDKIIAAGTDGHAKVLAAEVDPYWLLGTAAETRTIGAAAGLASVDINKIGRAHV